MLAIRCDICDIGVNTPEQLANHQRGKLHLKRLKATQFQQSMTRKTDSSSSQPGGDSKSADLWCAVCQVRCETLLLMQMHRNGAQHRQQLNAGSSDKEELEKRMRSLAFTLKSNRCDLCEVDCNTPEQLDIHRAGSQHQRNLLMQRPSSLPPEEEYRVESVSGGTQYVCLVCTSVWCNTLEQLDIHRRGANHLKRLRQRQETKVAPATTAKTSSADFDRCPGGAVRNRTIPKSDFLCNGCNQWLPNPSAMQTHKCADLLPSPPPTPHTSAWPDLPPHHPTSINGSTVSSESRPAYTSDSASTDLPPVTSGLKAAPASLSSFSATSSSSPLSSGSRSTTASLFDSALRDGVVMRTEDEHCIICVYCNLECNTPAAMEAHLSGGKHRTRVRRLGKVLTGRGEACESQSSSEWANVEDDGELVRACDGGMMECRVCGLKLNPNNLDSHLAGKKHAERLVKSLRAPPYPVPRPVPVRVIRLQDWTGRDANVRCIHEPRRYQWELFVKAMTTDAVVYLPTGTGKTMVAALTIGEMLCRNPHYQAVFLVDKTLLALQQADYLRQELNKLEVPRLNWEAKKIENRRLRIACLCGDLHDLGGQRKEPLWKQDIIVTTVGFYLNLLEKQVVSLDAFCLIVVDEAHHCVKEHPFHRLLKVFHRPMLPDRRPKLLGLTASPAGAMTFEETLGQLRTLLSNLGNIDIASTEHAMDELSCYISSNKITCVDIPMEATERDLQRQLVALAIEMLAVALPCSPHVASLRREMSSEFPNWDIIPVMLEQQMRMCEQKHPDMAEVVRDCLNSFFKLEAGDWELACLDVEKVCQNATKFENSSPDLRKNLKHVRTSTDAIRVSHASGIQISPMMRYLVQTVKLGVKRCVSPDERQMVIVLTSQRSVARSVTEYLVSHINTGEEPEKSVVCLVGHGSTSGAHQKAQLGERADLTKGMSVQQQRRALKEITQKQHHVIVATSVAEEGVDLPVCGLVVLLSPPTSMSAVVQMRGRARLKDSMFVVLCREEEQRAKFMRLLQRETNMFMAVKEMCRERADRR